MNQPIVKSYIEKARLPAVASVVTALLAIVVLLGWGLDIAVLKSIKPGYITMKANTASCFGLLALALWLLRNEETSRARRYLAFSVSSLVALLSLITLTEYLFDLGFSIDQMIFVDRDGAGGRFPPGRLAPITAVNFILLSVAFVIGNLPKNPRHRISQFFAMLAFLTGFQGLVGYLIGLTYIFGSAYYTQMAVHTAFGFVVLSLGLLASRSHRGFAGALGSDSVGATIARRMLAAVVVIPPLAKWSSINGQEWGLYDQDFAALIQVMANVVLMALIVISAANALLRSEKVQQELFDLERKARERAESANQAKTNFLANMSHELRTPLGAVLGFSDPLLGGLGSEIERTKYALAVRRNGDHLLHLVDDLLDLSKVEGGRFEVDSAPVGIRDFSLEIAGHIAHRARDKGIEFSFRMIDRIPSLVHTDARRLRQILMSVLGNAIKFTGASGKVTVELRFLEGSPSMLAFTITDTGIGISKVDAERLFLPFTQVDVSMSRKYGGAGVGLALSRRLARALGGDLRLAENPASSGSVFCVEVQSGAVSEESVCANGTTLELVPLLEKSTGTTERQFSFDGMRFLLVEDSPDNQLLISRILKMKGAEVEIASDGIEGIDKALHGKFDLVLMDIQMPNMDGYEAIQRLRGVGYQTPIIAITAHAMTEDRRRCLELGFDEHLTKPVNKRQLYDTVARIRSEDFHSLI